ncbi:CU044_5270 family protein [Nonomuraea candida]|uniref:CU044_5270 family protein n=1 Tax=Nonomuraea candida TaxID=359159 RepID=UPI000B012DDD|nr:CU044_5270 family protein [Nonomuraea candida]
MDDLARLNDFRSEVPARLDLRAEEERLLAGMSAPARPDFRRLGLRAALAGGLAAAVGMAVFAVRGGPAPAPPPPVIRTVAAVELLTRAAERAGSRPELRPRPGQFLVFRSQSMDSAESDGQIWLSRSKRTIWLPVEGSSVGGVVREEILAPLPYPGRPLPPAAREEQARAGRPGRPERAADFDHRAEFLRSDYAYVSELPADADGMRRHLYTRLPFDGLQDYEAWNRVGGLLQESYLPAAQRAALFRAAATIPGVVTVKEARDAAGREGIAAAMVSPLGVREEYVFDPETYDYLGRRGVVVDAGRAGAPVGSVVSSSAQLEVSVADSAPDVE